MIEKDIKIAPYTQYIQESAIAHRELDQLLRKWAVMSQFQADLDRYEALSKAEYHH